MEEWNPDEAEAWAKAFSPPIDLDRFREARINGKLLLVLDDEMLKCSLSVVRVTLLTFALASPLSHTLSPVFLCSARVCTTSQLHLQPSGCARVAQRVKMNLGVARTVPIYNPDPVVLVSTGHRNLPNPR
jgi:hypothetical protein